MASVEAIDQAKAYMATRLAVVSRYSAHKPFSKQLAFMMLPTREALYGGAAGGGKSDAVLMAALMYVDKPSYRALILRRTMTQLEQDDSIMDRFRHWIRGKGVDWNDTKRRAIFPSGAVLRFSYLELDKHLNLYQGAAYHFVGFDELTHFPGHHYKYMFSRNRRLKSERDDGIPLRIRAGTNPGGVGHGWVKERFVKPRNVKRPFIPSLAKDNEHLDQESYMESLAELDPVTRQQLQDGDWDVEVGGKIFRRQDFVFNGSLYLPNSGMRWVRYWDLAGSIPTEQYPDPDWTVGVKMGTVNRSSFTVSDVRRVRNSPKGVRELVARTAARDGLECEVWIEVDPGQAGKDQLDDYRRNVLQGYTVRGRRPSGDKRTRAGPWSSAMEGGLVTFTGEWWDREAYIMEHVQFTGDGKIHDDQVDASSGAHWVLTKTEAATGSFVSSKM